MSRLFDMLKNSEPHVARDGIFGVPVESAGISPETRLVFHTDPRSPGADRYRLLRMRLRGLGKAATLKTILITSPLPNDGKSTVCLNLATALAEGGKKKVLLMEADLHRPALTHKLGLKTWAGLAECLEGAVDPCLAFRQIDQLSWYLLPAGGSRANASELLQTAALPSVVNALSPHFDWIVVDSPPVLPLSDAISLTRCADATLLVARAGHTPRKAVDETIAILGGQRVAGIVLNGVTSFDRSYSTYYEAYKPHRSDRTSAAED